MDTIRFLFLSVSLILKFNSYQFLRLNMAIFFCINLIKNVSKQLKCQHSFGVIIKAQFVTYLHASVQITKKNIALFFQVLINLYVIFLYRYLQNPFIH